jgi:hypothetical protein
MNVRRFILRLAVAIITFVIGFTAATLFGATRHARFAATATTTRLVIVRDFDDDAIAPRFEHAPPCGSFKMQHAFGWQDGHEASAPDFDLYAPPPPSPKQQIRMR